MAELKSTTYTAQELAAGNAAKMIGTAELISGKASYLQCDWTVPSGTAASDTVLLGYLPSGMTTVPGLSSVTIDAGAGASTIDIGVAGQSDAISTGASLNTAGTSFLAPPTGGTGSFKSDTRETIVATLSGNLTAGRVVSFNFLLVNSN